MSIMVLGTASHVGKSTVVAAICRALVNRGIQVAPFKSQNMSLNSYVTRSGGEIGIAQAMQAYAARLEPHVDMNPILLKPKGDRTSQIVLLGRPYKDLPITTYYREVDHLLKIAIESAQRLVDKYGHIVIEGAGGAAEVNLYDRDIANIRLARELNVPIVLVADIERGGVFAMLYGTLALLPSDVRSMVRGIIINKFRGDTTIFSEGIRIIEELTGVPVLGVLPYTDIQLPSEDSLSIDDKKSEKLPIRIAVIRFPHISNFTDFELLERFASVKYVPIGAPLTGYDCIILPGTKNSVEDLMTLTQSSMADEIVMARERGIPIIGICGGFQILGQEIIDSGIESKAGTYKGLGLLDVTTKFTDYEKNTQQVQRQARKIPPILSEIGEVEGYEIHMGETGRDRTQEAFDGEGSVSSDGLVIGTYMHGLFNNITAVNALLSYLYSRKRLHFELISKDSQSNPYDRCAQWFESHINIEKILSFFGE